MTLIDVLAEAQSGHCFANLARRFQVTPRQAEACARFLKPVATRQIADSLQTDDGVDAVLDALADPATVAIEAGPDALTDPSVRQRGEALHRHLARHDIDTCSTIEDIARQAHVSHQTLRAMMPFLTLLFIAAIRKCAAPAFRKALIRYQPDDAATDPFVFVSENAARLRLAKAIQPRPGGWLEMILTAAVPMPQMESPPQAADPATVPPAARV